MRASDNLDIFLDDDYLHVEDLIRNKGENVIFVHFSASLYSSKVLLSLLFSIFQSPLKREALSFLSAMLCCYPLA